MTSLGAGVDGAYRVGMGQPGLHLFGAFVGFYRTVAITAVGLQGEKKRVYTVLICSINKQPLSVLCLLLFPVYFVCICVGVLCCLKIAFFSCSFLFYLLVVVVVVVVVYLIRNNYFSLYHVQFESVCVCV